MTSKLGRNVCKEVRCGVWNDVVNAVELEADREVWSEVGSEVEWAVWLEVGNRVVSKLHNLTGRYV